MGKLASQYFGGSELFEDDAAFIVRAVNSHHVLLAALKACRHALTEYTAGTAGPYRHAETLLAASEAIAKAEA